METKPKFMIKSTSNPLSLQSCFIFITISCLVPSSLCDETRNLQNFKSCLTRHNINNFTFHSSSDSAVYFKLLNFSIQNLRFSGSSVPKPLAIILPESREQLANSVLCCRQGSFEIRVRSGGHSYEGISSSIDTNGTPFVIIDLMNLDRISVDLEAEVAWVEGGATLGQTYYTIAEASRVHGFPAGFCPTVGVGGQFSGGGFGFLSRKYGLAADNVIDALLVDAEGCLLDRKGMGEDVFWAIRGGGGGNWGIVYAWKIKLVKVPKVVTTISAFRPQGTKYDQLAKLVKKWQNVAPKLVDEFHLMVLLGAGLIPRQGMSALFQGLYQGRRSKAISILNTSFPELQILEEECKEMSWIESVDYLSDFNGGKGSIVGLRDRYFQTKSYFKTKSDYVRQKLPNIGIKTAIAILEDEPQAFELLEPYGGFMEKTSSESIAFPHRRGNLFSIQYTVIWGEEDNNSGKGKDYIEWIRGFYDLMKPYVSSSPRAAYVNYMDLDLGVTELGNSTSISYVEMARAWGEKYFLKNYDRLVRAKTIIDPNNVFRHQQSIPPLSWKGVRVKADV